MNENTPELYQKAVDDDIRTRIYEAILLYGPSPDEIAADLGTSWPVVRDYMKKAPELIKLYVTCVDQIVDAIKAFNGNRSRIADKLGCPVKALQIWEQRNPRIKDAFVEAHRALIDLAKEGLVAKLLQQDWKAIEFTLQTQGKDEGWTKAPKRTLAAEADALGLNVTELRNKLADQLIGGLVDGELVEGS